MILRLTLPALLLESGLLWLLALRPLQDRAVSAIAILLGTSAVYLISAWLILKETQSTRRRAGWVLGWAILFRLTAWPLEPAFTDDVYRYRWESRLQEAGGNPYEAAPSDPGWARLRDVTYPRISGRDFRAVYGPLTEMVYHWTYRAIARFTEDPFRQCFWLKLPAAFLDLGVVAAICGWLWAAGKPLERVLLYAWSPLPVFEFWGNGHNDPLVLLPLVLALWAAECGRWKLVFTLLGVAISAKVWPAALLPVLIAWKRSRPLRWKESLLVFPVVGLSMAPYGAGLLGNLRFLSGFLGGWRNNDSVFGFLLWLTGDASRAKYTAFAVVAAAVGWVTLRQMERARAALVIVSVMLLVSSNCHPWYLSWFLVLLPLEPVVGLLLWTALVPIAYQVLPAYYLLGEWNGSTPIRWLIYGPVFAVLAWEMFLARKILPGR